MATGLECVQLCPEVLEQSISRSRVSTAMPLRKDSSYTCQDSTTPSAHAFPCGTSAFRLSRFVLPFLRYLAANVVAAGDLAGQVLRDWWIDFAFEGLSFPVPRHSRRPASRKCRVNWVSRAVPLMLLIICSSPARPASFTDDVKGQRSRHRSDNSVFTFPTTKASCTAGGSALFSSTSTHLAEKVTSEREGERSSDSVYSAVSAVFGRTCMIALIWSKAAGFAACGNRLLPFFTLRANAAELPRKQGTAFSAVGRSATSVSEEAADSEIHGDASAGGPASSSVSPADGCCRASPQASSGESSTEPSDSPAARTTAAAEALGRASSFEKISSTAAPFRADESQISEEAGENLGWLPTTPTAEREAEFDSPQKQLDRSSSTQVSPSRPAVPACHMSEIPGAAVGESVSQRLRYGTEQEQEEAARQLSRAHVRSWNCLPIEKIHAQRLPGGLTNRLYVVELREGGDQQLPTEGEGHPEAPAEQQQEIRKENPWPCHPVEGAVELGALRSRGETVEHDQKIAYSVSAKCSEKTHVPTDLLHPRKILFRVFGQPDSLHLFDPKAERLLFRLLSKASLAPQCIAEFPSGRIEEWIEGSALHVNELHSPEIQDMVVSELSNFHSADVEFGRLCCSSEIGCHCRWRQLLPSVTSISMRSDAFVKTKQQQQQQHVPRAQSYLARLGQPEQHDSERKEQREHREQEHTPTTYVPAVCVAHSPHHPHHHHSRAEGVKHHDIAQPDAQPCTCSLCRGRAWASLAKAAAVRMEAFAASAETHANALRPDAGSTQGACISATEVEVIQEVSEQPKSLRQAAKRPETGDATLSGQQAAENASADAGKETVEVSAGGASAGCHVVMELQNQEGTSDATARLAGHSAAVAVARQARASVEACKLLNLEKYEREVYLLEKAVQEQMLRELAPGVLERVYGGIKNWLLLSGASPVLSHNDLQENNVMNSAGRLRLIDFEYAGENARAADLSNFFCEMAINYTDRQENPYFTVDPSRFPSLDVRRSIISKYLRATVLQQWKEDEKQRTGEPLSVEEQEKIVALVNEEVVANFERMTRLYALASHLTWAFWSVVKAPVPQPADEFNYLEYAKQRLRMYDLQKEDFLGRSVVPGIPSW